MNRSSDTADPTAGYAAEHRPLRGYSILTATFGALLVAALATLRAAGRPSPERIPTRDILLLGIATHKLTRLIAKDKATSFVRAPFVTFEDHAGHGEVAERPRGTGLRYAVGELLVCPYCLGQWVIAALGVGYVVAPRSIRFVAAMYSAETVADFLQLGYKAAQDRAS
jgi:hypothetical protein